MRKQQPIPFTFATLLSGLALSLILTVLASMFCVLVLPPMLGIAFIAIVTFFSGIGFVLGAALWARLTQKTPVKPPAPNPDGASESN